MANEKKCKECGGTFLYVTTDQLCLSCSQRNELEFQKIKEFLKHHPKSSVSLVATELDINVVRIKEFIQQGRLEIIDKN